MKNSPSRKTVLAVCFAVLIVLQCIEIIIVSSASKPVAQDDIQPNISQTRPTTTTTTEPEPEPPVIVPMLVSKTHVMSEDYTPTNIVEIGDDVKGNSSLKINGTVLEAYKVMYADMKKDGVTLPAIISAYRPYAKQKQLYDAKVAQYGPNQKVTAAPGTSEHQYAACIDISTDGTCQNNFGELDIGKWVAANSYKYGFVIRYPSNKKELTGINFEPWHLRYVGVAHATKMYEMDMCLEEYVDYLRANYTNTVDEQTPDDFPAPRWAGDLGGDIEQPQTQTVSMSDAA
ncbi:MAG: M15 family metallopeptidase [Clostridia bacterium]|nr:M15 family metallopeptidase [Clostridia bacterium]